MRPFRPDDTPMRPGSGSHGGDAGTDESRVLRSGYLWLPVLAWMACIFILSSRPDLRFSADPSLDLAVRKVGHLGVFGILALLLWAALQGWPTRLRAWPEGRGWGPGPIGRLASSAGTWALVLTIVYASTDEFHQTFVAGRHGSALDVAIDTSGALIALTGMWWVARRAREG